MPPTESENRRTIFTIEVPAFGVILHSQGLKGVSLTCKSQEEHGSITVK
jgi:hypothetical protein